MTPLPGTDQLLTGLIAAISGLLALALLFTIIVIFIRVRSVRVGSQWQRDDATWETELLDVLAGVNSEEELRSRVGSADTQRFVDFLFRFAGRVRGEESTALERIALPYLDSTADQLRSRSPEKRARAVAVLSALGGATYRERLIAALDDESALVSMVAARSLAKIERSSHSGLILARIERFERWNPRHLAAMFAAVGPDAAPDLRATLADVTAPERGRIIAAEALLLQRDLASADVARAILEGWATPEVLTAALRLIAATGSSRDAGAVRRLVRSPHAAVRSAAMHALGSLGDRSDTALAVQYLEDPSPWVALNAAAALAELGGWDILETVVRANHGGAQAAREVLARSRA